MNRMKTIACALVAAAIALVPQSSWSQQPGQLLEFNYGIPTADHVTVFVAQDLNLFEKAGLKPKFFYFQSGAPLLAGLKSESLDVVTAGLALTFALGQDIPLKFLFWEANNSAGEGLVVDPKGAVKSYQDIAKAQKIGAASGTCAQVALYLMAKKVGVDYAKLNVVNIPAPLFRNSFVSQSIDAGISWPPYSLQLQSEGFPVASFDEDYLEPGGVCPGLTGVRPAFLASHPEIAERLIAVEAMARDAMQKNPQGGVDAFVKHLSVTPEVAKATLNRECCGRVPSFADQLDPASPFSMTSREHGLVGKLFLASQVLAATKAILLEVDQMAAEAVANDPQLAVDALVKRLALPREVAEAAIKRLYLKRPTVAQQLDPTSPYSLVSDSGLAANYELATQVLYETKSIPEPVQMSVIKDSIDGSYLKEFAASHAH